MTIIFLSAILSLSIPEEPQAYFLYIDQQYEWIVHENTWCKYISNAVYYYSIIELANNGIYGDIESLRYYELLCIIVEQTLEKWCAKKIIKRKV